MMPSDVFTVKKNDGLKIVALFTMIIDHVGVFFFPNMFLLRLIGRFAMPIYAYCVSVGCLKTRDIRKYLARMFVLALISQIPYSYMMMCNGASPYSLNTCFSWCFCIVSYWLMSNETNYPFLKYGILGIVLIVGVMGMYDYGIYALLVFGIFMAYNMGVRIKKNNLYLAMVIAWGIDVFLSQGATMLNIFGILSLPLIVCFKDKLVKISLPNYVFYYAYPIHLFVLGIIYMMMN